MSANQIPWVLLGLLVVVTGLLLVIAGVSLHDFGLAWEVLSGRSGSFHKHHSWITLPLAIDGYLLVPAVVGVVAGAIVQRMMTSRLTSLSEATKEIIAFKKTHGLGEDG